MTMKRGVFSGDQGVAADLECGFVTIVHSPLYNYLSFFSMVYFIVDTSCVYAISIIKYCAVSG
jgi:hypothetical protein